MIRVAFLRAVNVGRRTAKMAELAEIVRGLGYDDVWTHINSGNVVFEATGPRTDLETELGEAFEASLGFEATTFVRTAGELRRALATKPFRLVAGDTYFVTFLKATASKAQRAALEALSNEFDTLVVQGRDVHWRMHGKSTETQVPTKAWENIIGRHRSTSRNTTMLGKLIDKIDGV